MKETGFLHWAVPNTEATNRSEFSALPGGYRNDDGIFGDLGYKAIFWSSTQYDPDHTWYNYLYHNYGGVYCDHYHDRQHGFSVRCIYDQQVGNPGK